LLGTLPRRDGKKKKTAGRAGGSGKSQKSNKLFPTTAARGEKAELTR
jgi:hypothetical protein